jgi:mannose-6-phosphate isomerase-like protein (cupin superfamily)
MDATTVPATQPYSLAAGEGEAIWYVNNRATILATAAQTGGAFGLVHMEVAVGHGPPLHIHHAEDEAFWILEGHLTVRCGDAEFAAGPGSFVYTPRGVPHTFRLEGDAPARRLVLLTPGGGEGFFVTAGRPAEGPGLPPPAPPDVATLAAVAVQYHQENIGPPLAPVATRPGV